jgi:CubicO group peptidase (beta-lactamase class C family)
LLPDVKGLRGSGITVHNLLDMTAGFAMDGQSAALLAVWRALEPSHVGEFRARSSRAGGGSVAGIPTRNSFSVRRSPPMFLGIMLENATHEHPADWLAKRLWKPMGAEYPASWSLDSRASGFEKIESGINARPIDFLKIGQRVLRGGVTEGGERLL